MIPVVMENRIRNSSQWKGLAGVALKGLLYIDMTDYLNTSVFETKCNDLFKMIIDVTGRRHTSYVNLIENIYIIFSSIHIIYDNINHII